MEKVYKEIIDFIVSSGKRISKRAGNIEDIGIKNKYLTEEDLNIERSIKKIIKKHNENHKLFAEEEHNSFPKCEDVWIADPISGTSLFIQGMPHYAIVVAHTKCKAVKFAAVYDPTIDELFTAYLDKGAFLNGKPISISNTYEKEKIRVLYNLSGEWKDRKRGRGVFNELTKFKVYRVRQSFALNYCYVACGRYDGVVALTKDAFPEIAGGFIIREAGGIFKNREGEDIIEPQDRIFVGGNKKVYELLKPVVE